MKMLMLLIMLTCSLSVRADNDVNGDGHTAIGDVAKLIDWLLNPDMTNGHDYVDLGLPSGTLWATTNVGSASTTDYGQLFAWGETSEKSIYNWQTYQWAEDDTTLTRYTGLRDTLWLCDDAASRQWGGLWRMPTTGDWSELRKYCRWSWALVNGVYGYRVTNNGTGLFLPAAGYQTEGIIYSRNSSGFYWSNLRHVEDSVYAYGTYIDKDLQTGGYRSRAGGRSVRPVFNPSDVLIRYDINGDGLLTISDITALLPSLW